VFIGLYSTLDMSRALDTALREPLRDRGACELILKLQHGAGCALAAVEIQIQIAQRAHRHFYTEWRSPHGNVHSTGPNASP